MGWINGNLFGGGEYTEAEREARAAEHRRTEELVAATAAARAKEATLCGPPRPSWMAFIDVFRDDVGWWAYNGYEAVGPLESENEAVQAAVRLNQ